MKYSDYKCFRFAFDSGVASVSINLHREGVEGLCCINIIEIAVNGISGICTAGLIGRGKRNVICTRSSGKKRCRRRPRVGP